MINLKGIERIRVGELLTYRTILFIKLMQEMPQKAWLSKILSDGTSIEDHFIAGIKTPTGEVAILISDTYWDVAVSTRATVLDKAHKTDNLTDREVLRRLMNWVTYERRGSSKKIDTFSDFTYSGSRGTGERV